MEINKNHCFQLYDEESENKSNDGKELSNDEKHQVELQEDKKEPCIGLSFDSENAAHLFYNKYAKIVGFGTRIKSYRRSKVNDERIAGWFVCAKEGKSSTGQKTYNPRNAVRTGCQASMKVKRMATNKWEIVSFNRDHNHELDLENAHLFRSHKKILSPQKSQIKLMNKARVKPKNIMLMFKEQYGGRGNISFGSRECRNFIDKENRKSLEAGDANAIHMYFMHMHNKNPSFSYALELDDNQCFHNVFWVDAKSKIAYDNFGDVVTFDTTYLTNKYKMPFAPFVGVNHHGQSTLFGCALLADKTTESFIWLFRTWLGAMSGKSPDAIITDQSKAITAAIKEVFPRAHHRFCLWHIMKKIPEKLGYVCKAYPNFVPKFQKCIYDSLTVDEFEKRWRKVLHSFDIVNNDWLGELYEARQHWAPVFLKDIFFAGMSTSQRSESINSFFDKYVGRKTSLKEFIERYEQALEDRYEDEAQEDFWSFNSIPKKRVHSSPFELQLAHVYTRNIFKKFKDEVLGISSVVPSKVQENEICSTFLVKAYEVHEHSDMVKEKDYKVVWSFSEKKIFCICRLFEFKGYLCRHALAVFLALGILEIPSQYILKRWTKDAKNRLILGAETKKESGPIESVTFRFNDICTRALKIAEEASTCKEAYTVALDALQETLEKVVNANDKLRTDGALGNQEKFTRNTYNIRDPHVSKTVGAPKKRIKSGVEESAHKQRKSKNGGRKKSGQNLNTRMKVDSQFCVQTPSNGLATQASQSMAMDWLSSEVSTQFNRCNTQESSQHTDYKDRCSTQAGNTPRDSLISEDKHTKSSDCLGSSSHTQPRLCQSFQGI